MTPENTIAEVAGHTMSLAAVMRLHAIHDLGREARKISSSFDMNLANEAFAAGLSPKAAGAFFIEMIVAAQSPEIRNHVPPDCPEPVKGILEANMRARHGMPPKGAR